MPPPRIMFDDGSRIMHNNDHDAPSSQEESKPSITSSRGAVPLPIFYEIDRVAKDVVDKLDWSATTSRGKILTRLSTSDDNTDGSDASGDQVIASAEEDGFLCRVALQFPDELLSDAPDVSWLMETAITDAYKTKLISASSSSSLDSATLQTQQLEQHLLQSPLLFILGDTTYGSCCPDEVSANHLNANIIVHYGHACLAPTESVPVVYAFGVSAVGSKTEDASGASATTVDDVGGAANDSNNVWKECASLVRKELFGQNTTVDSDNLDDALDQKLSIQEDVEASTKLLILYEVQYHHAMEELKLEFEKAKESEVVMGLIPKQQLCANRQQKSGESRGGGCSNGSCGEGGGCGSSDAKAEALASKNENTCCESKDAQSTQSCCDAKDASSSCCMEGTEDIKTDGTSCAVITKDAQQPQNFEKQDIPRTIGGLEIPNELDLGQYTVLYIGDDLNIDSHESNAPTRLLHILLRCNAPDGPTRIWSYSPLSQTLHKDILDTALSPTNDTTLSTALSRTLRRRYFLLNKAKLATTIAILIGTTSNSYTFRHSLRRTRHRIQSTGRTAYTFAVGKLSSSAHKLSNFAEIDAFVLIACQETMAKFWKMEREEMLVPVLTPLELDVALGYREWDGRYSCDFGDLIRWDEEDGMDNDEDGYDGEGDGNAKNAKSNDGGNINDSDSDDEPFFSMISGKYEQSKTISTSKQNNHLESLPGQGKLIEYRSEAAEFLKKREYQGLEAKVGATEAKVAVLGQVGIASNYGEKL